MTTTHTHIVVSPGNGRFYCLSCGNTLSGPEASNILLSENYGALPEALAMEREKLEQDTGEINSGYCWVHSGPGLGGWSCLHLDCKTARDK